MSQQTINNGDTGLTVRTNINDNFTELYVRSFPVVEFGAVCDGVVDDYQAIADAIDAAYAAGGGRVILPAGVCLSSANIVVKSGVRLCGAGADLTIIRNPAGALPQKTINGASVNASISLVGVVNAGVFDLTLDHRTNVTTGTNGIQIGESGAASRSDRCEVTRCRVLGTDDHQYLIYVKLADNCVITHNSVYGVASGYPTQDIAGIELFGSLNSHVYGNYVERTYYGIIIKNQSDVAGSYVGGCLVHDNIIDYCVVGLEISSGAGEGLYVRNSSFYKNIITNSSGRAALISPGAGCDMTNIALAGNILRESATNSLLVVDSDASAVTDGLTIADNVLIQTGGTAPAIYILDAAGVDVTRNVIQGSPYNGILVHNSTVNIIGNTFGGSQRDAVRFSGTSSNCLVMNNQILDYGQAGAYRGVWADTTTSEISVINNYFKYGAGASNAYAVDLYASSNGVVAGVFPAWKTQNPVYRNGTGGRNSYGSCGYDRNVNRVSAIFPREVGVGQSYDAILTASMDIDGTTPIRMRTESTPASAGVAGNKGEVKWDANYIYICTATNTWKRAALTTW